MKIFFFDEIFFLCILTSMFHHWNAMCKRTLPILRHQFKSAINWKRSWTTAIGWKFFQVFGPIIFCNFLVFSCDQFDFEALHYPESAIRSNIVVYLSWGSKFEVSIFFVRRQDNSVPFFFLL